MNINTNTKDNNTNHRVHYKNTTLQKTESSASLQTYFDIHIQAMPLLFCRRNHHKSLEYDQTSNDRRLRTGSRYIKPVVVGEGRERTWCYCGPIWERPDGGLYPSVSNGWLMMMSILMWNSHEEDTNITSIRQLHLHSGKVQYISSSPAFWMFTDNFSIASVSICIPIPTHQENKL